MSECWFGGLFVDLFGGGSTGEGGIHHVEITTPRIKQKKQSVRIIVEFTVGLPPYQVPRKWLARDGLGRTVLVAEDSLVGGSHLRHFAPHRHPTAALLGEEHLEGGWGAHSAPEGGHTGPTLRRHVHFQLLEVAPGALDQHSAPFVARCEGQCVRVAVGILGADLHVSPIEDLLPAELGGQLLLLVVLRVAFEALGWSSVESHSLDGVRKLGVVAGARRCGYSCGATEQQC